LCCHSITKITRNGINGAMFVTRLDLVFSIIAYVGNYDIDIEGYFKLILCNSIG